MQKYSSLIKIISNFQPGRTNFPLNMPIHTIPMSFLMEFWWKSLMSTEKINQNDCINMFRNNNPKVNPLLIALETQYYTSNEPNRWLRPPQPSSTSSMSPATRHPHHHRIVIIVLPIMALPGCKPKQIWRQRSMALCLLFPYRFQTPLGLACRLAKEKERERGRMECWDRTNYAIYDTYKCQRKKSNNKQ